MSYSDNNWRELLPHNYNHELLSSRQTCQLLQINSNTLFYLVKKGRVSRLEIVNSIYFNRSQIMEMLTILKRRGGDK